MVIFSGGQKNPVCIQIANYILVSNINRLHTMWFVHVRLEKLGLRRKMSNSWVETLKDAKMPRGMLRNTG